MPPPTSARLSHATSAVLGVSAAIVAAAGIVTAATQSWHDGSAGPGPAITAAGAAPSPAAASPSAPGPSAPPSPEAPAGPSSAPSPASAPSPGGPVTSPAGGASASPGRASARPSPARTSHRAGATPAGSGPSSAAPAGITPGTYTYDETGSYMTSLGNQSANGTSTLVVGAPGADGYQTADKDGGQSSEDETLRFDPDGVHLRQLHVTFPTVDETFAFSPAVLFVPLPSATGKPWSWSGTSTDGKATVAYSGSIAGTTTDTVGGVTVTVTVIKSTIHFTGSGFDITITETDHFDEADRVVTETDQDGKGTISGVSFTSTTTEKLQSLKPS